jgi:hypothetical protein
MRIKLNYIFTFNFRLFNIFELINIIIVIVLYSFIILLNKTCIHIYIKTFKNIKETKRNGLFFLHLFRIIKHYILLVTNKI